MATTVQLAAPTRAHSPLALWHLLSLDAPTVAALWVWFIARSQHLHLTPAAPLAMALAVWMLYATDRLLDTRSLATREPHAASELETRHLFHHQHRRLFLIGVAVAAVALAALLPDLTPAAIHLYLAEGLVLIAWLAVLHATPSAHRLPKEIAVGLFFSAAVFIPTVAREPALRPSLLPPALLFGALCSLNCIFIYTWEHKQIERLNKTANITTRIAVCRLPALVFGLAILASTLMLLGPHATKPLAAACLLSFALLATLHRLRHHLSREHLRAAADLALLTPLLLLPWL